MAPLHVRAPQMYRRFIELGTGQAKAIVVENICRRSLSLVSKPLCPIKSSPMRVTVRFIIIFPSEWHQGRLSKGDHNKKQLQQWRPT